MSVMLLAACFWMYAAVGQSDGVTLIIVQQPTWPISARLAPLFVWLSPLQYYRKKGVTAVVRLNKKVRRV